MAGSLPASSTMTDNQKRDHALYYVEVPDNNFSPERNKAIVEETIRKHNAKINEKKHEYDDAYAERADATMTYLRSLIKGRSASQIHKYFSKSYLAYLRGEEIRKELLAHMKIYGNNGELIKIDL